MVIPIVVITIISFLFIVVNFIFFLFKGQVKTNRKIWKIIEFWTVVLLPLIFLLFMDLRNVNDCCSDSAIFSPEHRIGIYLLLMVCIFTYSISIFRKDLFTPIIELLVNLFLILGLVINVLLCFHLTTIEEGPILWIFGNLPIILLLLIKLSENQKRLKSEILSNNEAYNGRLNQFCYSVLKLEPIYKYPALLILLAPVIILLSLFLILFGQEPDSIIKAFTDTYKHGFSELDHMCDNVHCGGHFLCSVGANGHRYIVKPIRYGERKGNKIICTRQLLISNAFEELIQESFPVFHQYLRTNYNKIGKSIHKHYHVFNIKFISDLIYLLMKPLEWMFLFVLYTFDKKPENRIATQYLNEKDRKKIRASQNT